MYRKKKILGVLEGDCNTAAGIYANVRGKNLNIIAELFSADGNKKFTFKDECKIEEYNSKEIYYFEFANAKQSCQIIRTFVHWFIYF